MNTTNTATTKSHWTTEPSIVQRFVTNGAGWTCTHRVVRCGDKTWSAFVYGADGEIMLTSGATKSGAIKIARANAGE